MSYRRALRTMLGIAIASAAQLPVPAQTKYPAPSWVATAKPSSLLPVRGLYVQFETRGWPSGYWSGQAIQTFNDYDGIVGHTVAQEIAAQLDTIAALGVNTIAFELRSADSVSTGSFSPPVCNLPPALGLRYPQPTAAELTNLVSFFNLVNSKNIKVFLRLVNTHMEEQPPTQNAQWIGSILNAIKNLPALDLVLFEGNTRQIDTNGDGIPDECGIPAEPPLWLGPGSKPADYVKWAIGYAASLGLPYRKLSAEAVVGDFFIMSYPYAGPDAPDGHLWSPIVVLKRIFDDLAVPAAQRTYALSFYEHRKCNNAQGLECVDVPPHEWAAQTLDHVFSTIGRGTGARVVAPEMGLASASDTTWTTSQALQSLISLMGSYGVDGGCFWRWTSFESWEDGSPQLADPIKQRGTTYTYNPVRDVMRNAYLGLTDVGQVLDHSPAFVLEQNFPNPFNPSTIIRYSLPERSRVRLELFNVLGQRVARLSEREEEPGWHELPWNANLPSGVYYYRLTAASVRQPSSQTAETRKLTILR